jgi:hypothetical protein
MSRVRHFLAGGAVAFAAIGAGAATPVAADSRSHAFLATVMTGANERPGPGDPDGSGAAAFTINANRGRICYLLVVKNIAPATMAHIHIAPPTDPGPVVVPLAPPTSGFSAACTSVDRALAQAIIDNPQNYYVNVHTADFQPGAIRGQLG